MNKCCFKEAWIGQCKNECSNNNKYCNKHKNLICASCGKPATQTCSETIGLVCGAPLCDDCEHTICENGCNSGAPLPEGYEEHCKKDEQVYKPWLEQEYINKHGIKEYNKLVRKYKDQEDQTK